ncbi:fructuronate reductase [Novosphingobium sp. CF614]|uniref:mannitol dehydrogenase family protein n=1 Tax=Novosphingobium sp. CF614 TaxID=1884364 RepID=UPI0008E5AF20|nr:mannitol dehydrogenase family protein [Novosphingobium sp. CF614]SFG08181.1 fructuronate reductase [Novosphingobium sp. CF614]
MRLSFASLAQAGAGVQRCGYDRHGQRVGIVHFGIGAFHRAHQAWYTDLAMAAGERDWMISGVSLRSPDVAEQMNPQDGLYTVMERSAAGVTLRIVGSVREVLVARREPDAVVERMASADTRIVSFTVTEKGYCRAPDGSLDLTLAGEDSIYRFLRDGLARRRDAGLPGLTLLSCDNLADNGQQLQRLVGEYLQSMDPELGEWVHVHCTFPATMIDRIVPATTDADRDAVAAELGQRDEATVVTEPFSQWVIEDRFAGDRPRWEDVGAQLVSDVAPYEVAKLRMLNGAHSALAYLGLGRGYTYVHEAVGDPVLGPMVERLMREEAATSFEAAAGQDLQAYAANLLARFANPALQHRLIQIAMDGSQKIPQRWLGTLAAQQRKGRSCPAILAALAGWLRHARGDNGPVDDPRAAEIKAIWEAAGVAGIVPALFGPDGALSSIWTPTSEDTAAVIEGL